MKRLILLASLGLVFFLMVGGGTAYGQAAFNIPFKFEAAGNKFPAGEYSVSLTEDGKIILRRVATGDEAQIPVLEKLPQPEKPVETPQLIFDMVANFEPSYTEYVTDYLMAEVWLSAEGGYLVLAGERSEYTKAVKGADSE